jgi:hypothetical protein
MIIDPEKKSVLRTTIGRKKNKKKVMEEWRKLHTQKVAIFIPRQIRTIADIKSMRLRRVTYVDSMKIWSLNLKKATVWKI